MKKLPTSIEKASGQVVIHSIRAARQAQTAVRSRAWLQFLSVAALSIFVLLVADSFLQREEVGLRWLWLGLAIVAIGTAVRRLLIPAMQFRCSPSDITRWLDRRKSDSGEHLTVALELAQSSCDDSRYGCLAFREAALVERIDDFDLTSLKNVVCWKQLQRPFTNFCCAMGVSALFFGFWPEYGWQASRRLLMPWSAERWPSKDQLAFVDLPATIGPGTVLQVRVIDRLPPLPDDIRVESREADNASSIRSFPVLIDSDVAIVSLPPQHTNVQIRASGGDDYSMEWQDVQVVAVPDWKSHRFEVTLPEYLRSSQEAVKLLASDDSKSTGTYWLTGQQVQVPTGSLVRFMGELDRPVVAVRAFPEPALDGLAIPVDNPNSRSTTLLNPSSRLLNPSSTAASVSSTSSSTWTVTLDATGTHVTLGALGGDPLRITETTRCSFEFELEDGTLLRSPIHWTIETIPDRPPEVSLALAQLASISLRAPLPINAVARDDWGLRDLTAKLSLESLPELVLELPIPLIGSECEFPVHSAWHFSRELEAKSMRLQPQDQILVWIEAHDHLGQLGISQVERWSLEAPDRQLELLSQRQNYIAEQLQALLEMQITSQQISRELFEQVSQQPIQQSHVDAVAGIEQLQQSIHDQVSNSNDSIRSQMEQTLELLQQNGLNSSTLGSRMKSLLDTIDAESSALTSAAQDKAVTLQSQLRSMLAKNGSDALWQDAWSGLNQSQSNIVDSLRSIIERLDGNRALDRMRQELLGIADQQQQISAATQQTQLDQVQDFEDTSSNQLNELSNQQTQLAQELENWLQQMHQQNDETAASDSSLRSQLNQANQGLIQSQATVAMREAGSFIQSKQLGNATTAQRNIEQTLRQVVGQLADVEQAVNADLPTSPEQIQSGQLSLLRDSLGDLIEDQQTIIRGFANLSVIQRSSQSAEDFRSHATTDIVRQESIRGSLLAIRNQSDQLPVFQWAMDQAADDMSRAAAMARRRRIDPDAITSAQDALDKLSAMEQSLDQMDKIDENTELDRQMSNAEENRTAEESSTTKVPLASLKLLRCLQLELAQQTQHVEQFPDPVRQSVRRSELAAQQRQLAERLQVFLDEMRALSALDSSVSLDSEQESDQ